MNPDERKYYLVIRVGKNSFIPIDWTQTKFYHGENLYSLSGIDKYTSKILSFILIAECIKNNLISEDDPFTSFEILYIENGKNYTVKEGPIFMEDDYILSEDNLIEYIIENRSNKELINNIVMQCSIKETNELLERFKAIIRNISFYGDNIDELREDLRVFKELSYYTKRCISMRISNKIIFKEKQKLKEKRIDSEAKVA